MNHALSTVLVLELAVAAAAQDGTAPPPQQAPRQEPRPAPGQTPWQLAVAAAGRHHAPLLAFVLPPADAAADPARVAALRALEQRLGVLAGAKDLPPLRTARALMLRELQLLRRTDAAGGRGPGVPTRALAVFAAAVPVVCTAEQCGAKPGETVVLCGPDGGRTHGFALDLLDRDAFAATVGAVVLAPATLAARRANVAPALLAARERHASLVAANRADAASANELQRVTATLRDGLPGVAPALLTFADGELQVAPELLWLEEQRPPLGTAAKLVGLPDPCPPCGMAYVPPALSTVLQLLGP